MPFLRIVIAALPLLGLATVPQTIRDASHMLNSQITAAASAADVDQPAWVDAARGELADSPQYTAELISAINYAAGETGVDPAMLWCVAYTESHARHWHPNGKVKRGSSREIGLMQIKPFWAEALAKESGLKVDLFKVADNVLAAAYILKRGGDSPAEQLSYYNTGHRGKSSAYQRKVMAYWETL